MRWTPKVLAVAAGLMLGLPAAPAGAVGKMKASLNIVHRPAYVCGDLLCSAREHLTVKATVPLSPGELPNLAGYRIAIRVWGDDPVSDDLIRGPVYLPSQAQAPAKLSPQCIIENQPGNVVGSYFYRVSEGLTIRGCLRESSMFRGLNEDDTFPDYGDEIYAGVRLLNPQGATVRSAETSRVTGRW